MSKIVVCPSKRVYELIVMNVEYGGFIRWAVIIIIICVCVCVHASVKSATNLFKRQAQFMDQQHSPSEQMYELFTNFLVN